MVDHCAHRRTESRLEEQDFIANVSDFYLMLLITLLISVSVTFGKTAAGNSFNESYPGFQNDVVQPYLAWLKKVYGM